MLITQYRAAQKAGVNRQSIFKQAQKVPRPEYFIQVDGGLMVDDSHPAWALYCRKIKIRKGLIQEEDRRFAMLTRAVVEAIQSKYKPSKKELQEILKDIDYRYGVLYGHI